MNAWDYLHLGTDLDETFAATMRELMKESAPLNHIEWGELLTALCAIAE